MVIVIVCLSVFFVADLQGVRSLKDDRIDEISVGIKTRLHCVTVTRLPRNLIISGTVA